MKEKYEHIFKGKILDVSKRLKKLPNGKYAYLEEVKHPGAAIMVPFLGKKIVLLRQYRGVIDKYLWELPAGKLDHGETPYSCIKREITEETGYKVKNIKKLGYIYTSPGFCDEKIHVYKADCSEKTEINRDEDELIRVSVLSKRQIIDMFKKGRIVDSKTISALSFAGILDF